MLAVLDGLSQRGLVAALRAAERADQISALVAVDALAGQWRAPAIGAMVAIAGERPEPLAEELALEIGAGSWHAGRVRRRELRSFRRSVDIPLDQIPAYVRIRTNRPWAALSGTPEGAGRWRD